MPEKEVMIAMFIRRRRWGQHASKIGVRSYQSLRPDKIKPHRSPIAFFSEAEPRIVEVPKR